MLLGFLYAFIIRFKAGRWGQLLLFIVLTTLFGGYLMKIYAWKTILGNEGLLNTALISMGVIDQPISALLYSPGAIVVTLIHFVLPFAVLPIYASMRGIKDIEIEVARDLGARPLVVLSNIIVPRCRNGLLTAFAFSFLITAGDYVTPLMVGGNRPSSATLSAAVRQPLRLASRLGHVIRHAGGGPCRHRRLRPPAQLVEPAMNGGSRFVWPILSGLFVVFLLTPLVLVVVFSFTSRTLTNFPLNGLSLRWWQEMVAYLPFAAALQNSAVIGFVVGVVSAVVGTMCAIGLSFLTPRRAAAAMAILTLPIMLPPLVLAVALLSFFVGVGVRLGLVTVILAHILFTQPFVVMVVYARMANFDYRVVESARDLGAGPIEAFLTVTLPIIRPIVIGAALIAVSLSVDDFVITFFTIGSGNTLPTLVWGMIRTGLTPMVNAIGTLILVTTVGSSLIALRLTRYRG